MNNRIPTLVQQLYKIVAELELLYPGRKFTPDGHLVGSIGEVIAAERYGLKLLGASTPAHDAEDAEGNLVQIKATQGSSIGLRAEPHRLIVLKLLRDGTAEEIYNGPGAPVWAAAGKMQSNGQRAISLSKLNSLSGTK